MVTAELIDSIRSLLAGRPTAVAGEVLALEYGRQCREVNVRLGKIALMLESGGEIQALQLAEQAPPVVDAALALSFGGEAAWQDYCHDHGHEVAPVIDARSLDALLAVQAKGLASNHPLYRDYRAAVSSRADDRAHDLIRVIARLNPGDENAAKELKRLQRKTLQAALTELRDQLEATGEPLLAAMQKVEQAGAAEDYQTLPEWQQAVTRRNLLRQSAAWSRLPELLRLATEQLAAGEWRQAAVLHGEFGALTGTYGFNEATAGLAAQARQIGEELNRHRSAAARSAEARHLVAQLERLVEEIATQAQSPTGLTPAVAAPLLDELTRKLQQHDGLQGESLAADLRAQITAAQAQLRQVLAAARRSKRLRFTAALTATVAVLISVIVSSAVVWRATSHTKLLASLRSQAAVSGVRDLVARISRDEPLLLKFPTLSAEVAQARLWLDTMDANAAIVGLELQALEAARGQEFAALAAPDLQAKLQEAESLVAQLPGELGAAAVARLTLVRNDGHRVLLKRQQQNGEAALALAKRWTAALERIDPKGPATAAANILEPAAGELAPILELAAATSPLVGLPAATATIVAEVAAKLHQAVAKVAAVTSAQTALNQAETSAAYREALAQLAACDFAEGTAAQRVMAVWPATEQVKAVLLFRGDAAALEAAAADANGPLPVPAEVSASDREIIDKLTTSEVLNNLWEVVWKNGKGVQYACLSRGEVERNGQDGWKGSFATYPQLASNTLKFKGNRIPAAGGNILVANRPTATSAMMSKLRLTELLNANGINFRASVLPLLDRVANDAQAKPLAKAYVLSQLFDLVENHPPTAWGLHYCPGLVDEIKAFRALELKTSLLEAAWLLDKEPDYAKVWAEFFAARGKKWGYEEMRQTRAAAAAILPQEPTLAGRVDPAGTVVLIPATINRLILAVSDAGDDKLELRVAGIAAARAESVALSPSAVAYSPLLTVALTDELQAFLLAIQAPRPAPNPNSPTP